MDELSLAINSRHNSDTINKQERSKSYAKGYTRGRVWGLGRNWIATIFTAFTKNLRTRQRTFNTTVPRRAGYATAYKRYMLWRGHLRRRLS